VKKFIQQIALSLALVAPFAASAGNGTGLIDINIGRETDGFVFIRVTGTPATAACANANPGSFVVNGTTPGGAVAVRRIDIAYSLGKSVYVVGKGTCNQWPGYEDIHQINLMP
jgi:hypothetical protein